ncbi:MAG: hypothetical protein HY815_32210 [Candidatus Riflebacteria bacterium]|nr:hypothetical protein [Candidatus Riflebacteria bacterium]
MRASLIAYLATRDVLRRRRDAEATLRSYRRIACDDDVPMLRPMLTSFVSHIDAIDALVIARLLAPPALESRPTDPRP